MSITEHMNKSTSYKKRNVVAFVIITLFLVSVGLSASAIIPIQDAQAQTKANTASTMMGSSGNQNKSNIMLNSYGPNFTGSVALGPTIAKAIASQVHVSLANASTIAEKTVGANAHAEAVRLGAVHGFLVYMAIIADSNNGFHGVLVDPGNGKVLASTPVSMAALMSSDMGMMGSEMGMGVMGSEMNQGMMSNSPGMMVKPHH
ncbi:MAG TPA: hypothetical protein VFI73_01595 [Candidatus Nitrosopolaris sp.]|nr:hypothetical protein [Candidatus Nitrosopolaris sp.]